jgi:hypothetical protein
MICLSRPQDRGGAGGRPPRLGADACPGIDERGRGLTMSILHDSTCCTEWAAGQTPWRARAREFQKAAAPWGTTWPPPGPRNADNSPGPAAGDNRSMAAKHSKTNAQEQDR